MTVQSQWGSSGRGAQSSWWRRWTRALAVKAAVRADAEATGQTPTGTGCALEALEPRLLLSAAPVATPQFLLTYATGTAQPAVSASPYGLTPATIRQAYGINAVSFGSVTGDGTGQTIAIVDAYSDPNIAADLHTFDTQFGLPDPVLTQINETGGTSLPGTDPSGKGDSWAVEISLDVEWAHVVAPKANILLVEASSDSYNDLMTAVNTARNWAGVSVVSMSWDGSEFSGETSYDSYFTTPPGHQGVTFLAASGDSGAGTEYPAVSPNVIAVGGTFLTTSGGSYVSESAWSGSGGGLSSYEAQPAYQKGVVTQSTTRRAVPDVAMDASPSSGVAVVDSWDFGSSTPWVEVGGTSLATPLWAGVIALADQGRVLSGQTTLDGATQTLPKLYALPSTDFHDITTGSNGYAAAPGFDLATGRGSPIVNLLVPGLVGSTQPVPSIGSFTVSPSSVLAGTAVTLTAASVQESGGTISKVAFYRESNGTAGLQIGSDTFLGDGTQSGTTWTLLGVSTAGLTPGNYTYYAVATDSKSISSSPDAAALTVTAPAPANNNFASATVLSGTSLTVTGTNVGATKETGEPNIAGNAGGASVWYVWTAGANGTVSLNTHGSNFDTLLGVYTGNAVSALTLVASNDDDPAGGTLTSALTFSAVKGTTYHVAVDGYNGATGNLTLNLSESAAPANDNFANATILSGTSLTVTGTNVGATKQPGEPNVAGNRGGASVWYTWTATVTGAVALNTLGSNFDTLLGVYKGTVVSALTLVAGNDDASRSTLTSALTFQATAGTVYHFVVDGYNGAAGSIVLNLTETAATTTGTGRTPNGGGWFPYGGTLSWGDGGGLFPIGGGSSPGFPWDAMTAPLSEFDVLLTAPGTLYRA